MPDLVSAMPWGPKDELRKARKDAGLDQDDLAALIGVTAKTISRWENGHSEPSISEWRAIAQVTGAGWLLAPIMPHMEALTALSKHQEMLPGFTLPPANDSPELAVA